jgi:hypothetical protein
MPDKHLPFGFKVDRDLSTHMPRKEIVRELEREVVNVVPKKCAYTVTFERDEYGRIKSPITIKPI